MAVTTKYLLNIYELNNVYNMIWYIWIYKLKTTVSKQNLDLKIEILINMLAQKLLEKLVNLWKAFNSNLFNKIF